MNSSKELIVKGLQERSNTKVVSVMKVALLLWPVWIVFDYFLAQDLFPLFVALRLVLVVYTGIIYWLLIHNKLSNFSVQCLFLIPAFFEISFMFNTVPKEVMNFYFMGGTMVLIARFSFLMLPLKRGVFFAFMAIGSIFITNLIFDIYSPLELINEGGILYIAVALFSAFLSYFQYNTMLREVKTQLKVEETNLKLNKALGQKDLLLGETHHRVKNNLQIISSLIRIQQSKEENTEASEVLKITQNRIEVMTILHEELYKSENFEEVGFNEYIPKIVLSLVSSYERKEIEVIINSNQDKVDLIKLIPCGLIINELVTNSIKHAFNPVKKSPQILIEHKLEENKNVIIYLDNGSGFKDTEVETINFNEINSFGLRLINGLVNQIEGKLWLESDESGTKYTIIF